LLLRDGCSTGRMGRLTPGKEGLLRHCRRADDQALPVLTTGGPMSRFTAGTVLRYL
jgi:hypothetical protein